MSDNAKTIEFEAGYNKITGSKGIIGIWTGEADDAFVATGTDDKQGYIPSLSPSVESRLKLAGLFDSEIKRFKEKLLNQHLENLDNDISVPDAPLTSPLVGQMKISNDLKLQKETREIKLAEVDIEYKKTDIQTKLRQLQLQESSNSMQEATLTMMGNFYLQNEKMIAGFERINANLGELRGTLSSINSKLESQKQVNLKQLDKLNQELEKNININGINVNSLELQDMKNKELYTSASDENNFSLNDGLGIVEDLLTDGFDLDSNPLTMFLNDVKEEFEKESKEIEVKYNIKGVK